MVCDWLSACVESFFSLNRLVEIQSTLPNSNSLGERKIFELEKVRITEIRIIEAILLGEFQEV